METFIFNGQLFMGLSRIPKFMMLIFKFTFGMARVGEEDGGAGTISLSGPRPEM